MFKGKIKRAWKSTDILILLIAIPVISYAITGFYPSIERLTQSLNLDLIFLVAGATIGITICLNQYQKEEVRFLFLQTYNIQIISLYHIFKMLIPLLGISCILLVSLLLYHDSIIRLLELHIEFILGYFLGGNLSFLFNISKKHRLFNIISNLFIFIPSCFNGYLVLKVITGFLFIICFIKFSAYNWEGYLYHSRHLKQTRQKSFISKRPVLKKEFLLMFRFQRIFPLLIVFVCGQFVFYILHELKLDAFIVVALVLVALMHDTWTLNSIGLEESAIYLYIYSRLPIKNLVLTKWGICFLLASLVGASDYIFWSIYYNDHVAKIMQNTLVLLLFSFLISALYIYISIHFSDFDRRSYYRINFKGILASVVCVILLFFSYFISVNLLLIESVVISFSLLKLLSSEKKLRGFFNA